MRRGGGNAVGGGDGWAGGGADGGGREPWAEALAFRSGGGKSREVDVPMTLSGPDFGTLWESFNGSVLEKVMRRIELPSHVSRHRPPLDEAGAGGAGGGCRREGSVHSGRRLSRSGSGASVLSGMMVILLSSLSFALASSLFLDLKGIKLV